MSIVHHSFHIISRQLAYVAIVIASVLTLIVASVYWLSNAVEQRQDEIAAWVSDYIGYPVTMTGAGLHWVGFEPKLDVENITIFRQNGQEQLLSLQQLYLGLDIINSIRQTEPVINDVALSGLDLAVIRNEQGQFVIQGLKSDSNTSTNKDWLRWLNLINRLNVDNITLALSDFKQPSLSGHYVIKQAQIEHDLGQWALVLNLDLPKQLGNAIQVTADASLNSNLQPERWQIQARLGDIELASLSDSLIWQDVALTQGTITANVAANGSGYVVQAVQSSIEGTGLNLSTSNTPETNTTIEQLSGQFDWTNSSQQWLLSGHDIALRMNGAEWTPTEFSLTKQTDNGFVLTSNYLRLSDLTAIASLTEHAPTFIRQQKPAGDVESLIVKYSPDHGVTSLAFKLQEGGLLPWQDYPGVTGLSATVNWSNGLGTLQLDSHQVTLYPEGWLEQSVYFDSVSGLVRLKKTQDMWTVESQAVRLWNDDLTLQVDGSIERSNDNKLVNNLSLSLQDVDISSWKSYVPQQILEQDFKEWSNDAFVAGKVLEGKIELVGNLADFPYDNAPDKGRFTMDLKVDGVQLHYAPEWPDIVDVKGAITSEGSKLVIHSKQGKIADFDFIDVTTTIERFVLSNPVLFVNGDMTGGTQQALQFLQNSPLKQRFGAVSKTATAQGVSNIHLDLTVPLTHVDDTQASGHVSFKDSTLTSVTLPELAVTNVNGVLNFNNDGVNADAIQAQFLNDNVMINVSPEQGKTTVVAKGLSSIEKLKTVWADAFPEFVRGPFAYQLDVSIAEKTLGDFYVDAVIHSDLLGVNIDLPAPFTKQGNEAISFRAGFEHVNDDLVYTLNYQDIINAVVLPQDNNWRGELRIGSGQARLPEHGIKLRGQLNQLSVDDWLAWQSKQNSQSKSTFFDSLDDVSMTIDTLSGFNQTLTQLNLSMQRDAQGWRTQFHSEQSKGALYLPNEFDSNARLNIDIDKLSITLPDQSQSESTTTDKQSAALWPAIAVNIGALTVNEMNLGQLSLHSTRTKNSWTIEQASLVSDYMNAAVTQGVWQKSATGDTSHFAIEAKSDDLAGLLHSLGYVQAIDARDIDINLDFSWSDEPLAVSTESIQGQLAIDVGKGKLTELEPGAAGRIFGLLSIAALPRRLSLDFSDLFGKGFNFDSISGSFDFANGIASTDNMTMKGESAIIEMKGPIDITNKSYNQQVKVTPNVSSTLPLAGAMAGGPVGLGVGAAILLFDKLADNLFDKNIVNLISYKYDLTGPWHDPQLTVVKPITQ